MLSFALKCSLNATSNGADRLSFRSGMASNLIQEIRILSKNGTEVDRCQNADVLANMLKDFRGRRKNTFSCWSGGVDYP